MVTRRWLEEEIAAKEPAIETEPTLSELMQAVEMLNARFDTLSAQVTEVIYQNSEKKKREEPQKQSDEEEKTGETSAANKTVEILKRLVEITVFTGENPEVWILQAERFFSFYRSTEAEKREIAFYSMRDEARIWFQSEESQHPIISWDDFRDRLLKRFGSGHGGSPYTRLMNLKQIGLVADYLREFEWITATARGLSPEFLEEAFLNGLKPEIAEEVKLFCSSGLSKIKEMAQRIENKNKAVRLGRN